MSTMDSLQFIHPVGIFKLQILDMNKRGFEILQRFNVAPECDDYDIASAHSVEHIRLLNTSSYSRLQ